MVGYWLAAALVPLFLAGTFNYTIDPLWCFSHSNFLNQRQPGFNERQQKTNRLYFTGSQRYDTLLLGSSRSGYIDQHAFKDMKVYNYAANKMMAWEFDQWINIAQSIKGGEFDNIIIGLDFFNTSELLQEKMRKKFGNPYTYYEETRSFMYRYKTLLNLDALEHSYEAVKRISHPTISDYDRRNVRHAVKLTGKRKKEYTEYGMKEYLSPLGREYRYDQKLFADLVRIKNDHPRKHFYVFTTPVSEIWFKRFVLNHGHLAAYKKWLRELVAIFGTVYHFMDLNSVTRDYENFFDAHHLYPEKARYIALKMTDPMNSAVPQDFGKVLTKETIDRYMIELQRQIDRIK